MLLLVVVIFLVCLSLSLSLYNHHNHKLNIIISNNKYKSSLSSPSLLYSNEKERTSLFEATEDEDEDTVNAFKTIASSYLFNKFRDCRGDTCRELCDKNEVTNLVKQILPPVSKDELSKEIDSLLKNMEINKDGLIDTNTFLKSVINNSYWLQAGPLVVKELIFLDCLHNYYFEKRPLLEDDDYNNLKEQLTWEGSVMSTMKSEEAHFITAVASNAKGIQIMSDDEYNKLKSKLVGINSWVVSRKADPLAKSGLDTFLSYLKLSMG